MKQETYYDWNENTATAIVTIFTKNPENKFVGVAACHPDDIPYCKRDVGIHIAEVRAKREIVKYLRDCEIKPALKALTCLQNNMKTSKSYNPKSYEARMLQRQIRFKQDELKATKSIIDDLNQYIRDYSSLYIKAASELVNAKDKVD